MMLQHAKTCKRFEGKRIATLQIEKDSINLIKSCNLFSLQLPHQWPIRSALKTSRRQVPGSIRSLACRPSLSLFSVVFSETPVNTGKDPLKETPRNAFPPRAQVPHAGNWP